MSGIWATHPHHLQRNTKPPGAWPTSPDPGPPPSTPVPGSRTRISTPILPTNHIFYLLTGYAYKATELHPFPLMEKAVYYYRPDIKEVMSSNLSSYAVFTRDELPPVLFSSLPLPVISKSQRELHPLLEEVLTDLVSNWIQEVLRQLKKESRNPIETAERQPNIFDIDIHIPMFLQASEEKKEWKPSDTGHFYLYVFKFRGAHPGLFTSFLKSCLEEEAELAEQLRGQQTKEQQENAWINYYKKRLTPERLNLYKELLKKFYRHATVCSFDPRDNDGSGVSYTAHYRKARENFLRQLPDGADFKAIICPVGDGITCGDQVAIHSVCYATDQTLPHDQKVITEKIREQSVALWQELPKIKEDALRKSKLPSAPLFHHPVVETQSSPVLTSPSLTTKALGKPQQTSSDTREKKEREINLKHLLGSIALGVILATLTVTILSEVLSATTLATLGGLASWFAIFIGGSLLFNAILWRVLWVMPTHKEPLPLIETAPLPITPATLSAITLKDQYSSCLEPITDEYRLTLNDIRKSNEEEAAQEDKAEADKDKRELNL